MSLASSRRGVTPGKISRRDWTRVVLIILSFMAGSQSGPVSDWAEKLMRNPIIRALIDGTQVLPPNVPDNGPVP